MGWCSRTTCPGWMSYCGERETNHRKPSSNLVVGVSLVPAVKRVILPISPSSDGDIWSFYTTATEKAAYGLGRTSLDGAATRIRKCDILRILSKLNVTIERRRPRKTASPEFYLAALRLRPLEDPPIGPITKPSHCTSMHATPDLL